MSDMQKWVNIINESQTGYLNDIDNCNSPESCEPRSVLHRSKPELQPGDMVRIENVFGDGNGEGFGIFQAYSLDGDTVICNVDSRVLSFPVEFVSLSPEQNCEDKFASTGNDGSLSPMSLSPMSLVHDENEDIEIKNIGEAKMGNLESWMHMIEQAEKDDIDVEEDSSCAEEELEEGKEEDKEGKEDCDCGKYDCKTCFPDDDKVVDESRIQEVAYSIDSGRPDNSDDGYSHDTDAGGSFDEGGGFADDKGEAVVLWHDLFGGEEVLSSAQSNWLFKRQDFDKLPDNMFDIDPGDGYSGPTYRVKPDQFLAMLTQGGVREDSLNELRYDPAPEGGFNAVDDGPQSGFGDEEPVIPDMAYGDADAGEDVSELIGQIEYIQDMGMSNSDKNFSAELLMNMDPRMVQRIHAKVTGEVDEAIAGYQERGGKNQPGRWDTDDPEYKFSKPGSDAYDQGDMVSLDSLDDDPESEIDARQAHVAKHVLPGYNESESMIKPIPTINESANKKKLHEGADPDILKINDMLKR